MDLKEKARQDSEDQKLIFKGGKSLELAITNIYMRYAKDIQSYYVRRRFNSESAEDMLQEVFIKLLKNKEKLSDVKMIGPWLWRLVFTTMIDKIRSPGAQLEQNSISDEVIDSYVSHSESTDLEDLESCIEACFQQMAKTDEKRANALRLVVMYEWNNEQLAVYLDKKTKHATSEYISQSRKKIKPCFEECRSL